jgi:hypothetical protein
MQWSITIFSQGASYLWPVQNVPPGENILYQPQDYIGEETNFDRLIITAAKGSVVQSPVDGEIIFYRYTYYNKLNASTTFHFNPANFEEDSKIMEKESIDDLKFLSATIGIKIDEENMLHISGIRPVKGFKTGERVEKGDIIGTVGYFYHKIDKPTISVSISQKGKPADPMSPFGLKGSFQKPEQKKSTFLTKKEARFDYELFVRTLEEVFPGLYDYITEQEFKNHVSKTILFIDSVTYINDFERMIVETINKVRDSHLMLLSSPFANNNPTLPTISIGWLFDSLIVTRTVKHDDKYFGRRVVEVDGIPADSLKQIVQSYITGYDGYVESYSDFTLLTVGDLKYFHYMPNASRESNVTLKFDDGETLFFEGYKILPNRCLNLIPSWRDFYLTNQYKQNYNTEKLSEETAYLGLGTFELNEVEMKKIADFIKSISSSQSPNLIIDLRNNYGGNSNNLAKIFSYIAQKPYMTSEYSEVKKRSDFTFTEYCLNHTADYMDLFPDYATVLGKEGYYLYSSDTLFPDSSINFKGKIFVLTNERSISASAVFAGLVKKHNRGVIVGRETGSTYHQMKALHFVDLRLPHSNIDIRIPLVKVVFDSAVNNDLPWGRGVLPDYPVPFSLDELSFKNGDAILNYTMQLIQDGQYIKKTANETLPSPVLNSSNNIFLYTIFLLICIILLLIFYLIKQKK